MSLCLKTFGFAGGREDIWHPEEDTYWGSEKEWLAETKKRYSSDEERESWKTRCSSANGLNLREPEGVDGTRPARTAKDVRETFKHGNE